MRVESGPLNNKNPIKINLKFLLFHKHFIDSKKGTFYISDPKLYYYIYRTLA